MFSASAILHQGVRSWRMAVMNSFISCPRATMTAWINGGGSGGRSKLGIGLSPTEPWDGCERSPVLAVSGVPLEGT
jgi:hypothetical protein